MGKKLAQRRTVKPAGAMFGKGLTVSGNGIKIAGNGIKIAGNGKVSKRTVFP